MHIIKHVINDFESLRFKILYPFYIKWIQYFKSKGFKIIYDMLDDVHGFKDKYINSKKLLQQEKDLLKSADLVICTAKKLEKKALKYNKNVILIPNAVQPVDFYASRKKGEKPPDLPEAEIYIGYYGAIWEWFDIDLLCYLAENRSKYAFILLGTISPENKEIISNFPNIHYLGRKSYHELPKYLRFFTVAIIPFKINNLTKSTNPTKVYEYLAGGKPVVTTDLPEIRDFPYVYVAKTKQSFLMGIDKSLNLKIDYSKIDQFLSNLSLDLNFYLFP